MISHRSPGITSIYNEVKTSTRNRVLDLGAMTQGTFQFFSQLSCKIHFENLDEFISEQSGLSLSSSDTIGQLDQFLSKHAEDVKFDVILAWDLFNYLELPVIQALLDRLSSYSKSDTLLHYVKYLGHDIPVHPKRFQIVDQYYVQFNDDPLIPRAINYHETAKLLKHLPGYYMQSTLMHLEGMHHGIAEHVLRYMPEQRTKKMYMSQAEVSHGRKKDVNGFHVSPAVNSLIEVLRDRPFARVLDLGAKVTENVEFWRNCSDEVFSEDLYASIRWRKATGIQSNSLLSREALAFDKSVTFDAIIIWDLLNFCEPNMLREIGDKLVRFCKAETKLIVMAYTGKMVPVAPQEFHLNEDGTINIVEVKKQERTVDPMTSVGVMKLIPGFTIKHTYVFHEGMRQGICEFVFEYKEQAKNNFDPTSISKTA